MMSFRTWRFRALAAETVVAFLFLILSIVMTWPLAVNLDRAISDPGDPFFTTWAIDWDFHAMTSSASLFDANIFYPARNSLAFSEHMFGLAIVLFPLLACGIAPLTAHNIGMLLGFAGCGYAMYSLGRWVTKSTACGILGGIAFAFVGFRFHHLPHLHFVWSLWLPVMLLALLKLAHRPTLGAAAMLAAATVMNGLTSLHWLVFGTPAIVVTAMTLAAVRRRFKWRFWALLSFALGISAVLMLPFLWPYHTARELYQMARGFADVYPNSAEWRDWLYGYYKSALYGRWSPDNAIGHERTLLPGVTVAVLAVMGLARSVRLVPHHDRWRRGRAFVDALLALALLCVVAGAIAGEVRVRVANHLILSYTGIAQPVMLLVLIVLMRVVVWPSGIVKESGGRVPAILQAVLAGVTWVVLGLLGARGLRGEMHTALYRLAEPYQGIRVPSRWAMLAYVGLALLAAVGAARLVRHRSAFVKTAVVALLTVVVLGESWVQPIRWYFVPLEHRPVYSWLRAAPFRGGVLELPMDQWFTYEYLWRATEHHRYLINGVSSYTPRDYEQLASLYAEDPLAEELLHTLERVGCSLIVVHEGILRERGVAIRKWLSDGVEAGRLKFVRRFDAGATGDYVFALTAIEPQAASWQVEIPDAAGRTPAENAETFLRAGTWTYSSDPFAMVDLLPRGTIRGHLAVAGWTLAPEGVRSVNLRFANGRYVVAARRYARPDVGAVLPWHPDTAKAGFAYEFSEPPSGIDGDTDLQIQIVTNTGREVIRAPILFAWRPSLKHPPVWKQTKLAPLLERMGAPKDAGGRLMSGSAAIQDYVDPLMTDPDVETDARFAERVVRVLLNSGDDRLYSRTWSALANGVGRRRVIHDILRSREFAAAYLSGGEVAID